MKGLIAVLNIDVEKILDNGESRYSLVIASAKRARDIAERAEEDGDILIEKPVSLAIDELMDGKYKLVESDKV